MAARDDLAAQISGRNLHRGPDDVGKLASSVVGVGKPAPTRHKYTAEDANYTTSGPDPFICGNCRYMQPDNTCELVQGPMGGKVDPEGTCRLWEAAPSVNNRHKDPPRIIEDGGSKAPKKAAKPGGEGGGAGDGE